MKNIRMLLMAVLMTFSYMPGFAQKCKVTSDPITGEKLITANYKERWVYLESRKDEMKFQFVWWFPGALNEIIQKESEVIFKLESGEIIKLNTISDADPKRFVNQVGVFTAYTYEFILDKDLITKFSNSKIALIRVPDVKSGSPDITGKDKFGNLGKKYFKIIQNGAEYITSNL